MKMRKLIALLSLVLFLGCQSPVAQTVDPKPIDPAEKLFKAHPISNPNQWEAKKVKWHNDYKPAFIQDCYNYTEILNKKEGLMFGDRMRLFTGCMHRNGFRVVDKGTES